MTKIGVIGCGLRISGLISDVLCRLDPELRVVAVIDPDEENVRQHLPEADRSEAKFFKSIGAMVRQSNLDGLMIGTRCHQHAPYAIQAAKYDIPLFLEKPVAINMRQANSLEKAFAKTRCKVVVSFPLRVSPLCKMAHQLVKDGAVGQQEHVLAVNYVPYGAVYWEQGYRDFSITQGLFLQKATHDFDYLSYLMESPIVRVAAMANYGRVFGGNKPTGLVCADCGEQDQCLESPRNRRRNDSAEWDSMLTSHPCVFSVDCGSPETGTNEDCSSALLEFESGAHGVYTQVFFSRRDAARRGATVSGYMGTISFDWYRNELTRFRHHHPFSDTSKASGEASHFGGDDELCRNFLDLMAGKAESRTPIELGIQSVHTCLAAKESAENCRFVRVRQVGS